jgi:hypothetical protein
MANSSTQASPSPVSEIDRLIELATDKSSAAAVSEIPTGHGNSNHLLALEERKDSSPSMWRVLLQLRALLPYLARVLPLLERAVLGTNVLGNGSSGSLDTSRFEQGIEGLQGAHRDLSTQLNNQATEIKQLHEQMTWLSRSLELETQRQAEISENVASLKRLVKVWGIIIATLLLVLTGAIIFLALGRAG